MREKKRASTGWRHAWIKTFIPIYAGTQKQKKGEGRGLNKNQDMKNVKSQRTRNNETLLQSILFYLRAILIEIDKKNTILRISSLICEVHEAGYTVLETLCQHIHVTSEILHKLHERTIANSTFFALCLSRSKVFITKQLQVATLPYWTELNSWQTQSKLAEREILKQTNTIHPIHSFILVSMVTEFKYITRYYILDRSL